MTLQEQINLITPGETLTISDRKPESRQQAEVSHMLRLIVGREEYHRAWGDAKEDMEWNNKPLWWQHEALTRWLPLRIISRLPGDTEALLLEEAGEVFLAWRDGENVSDTARTSARGARAADRGTRLLRWLVRGGACAGSFGA